MRKQLPIFYNALLLTAVNLMLRFVSTSFQVHISNRIGPEGVGLLQLVMSVGSFAMTFGMAGIRTATMYLSAEELGRKRPQNIVWVLRCCLLYSIICSGTIAAILYFSAPYLADYWIGNSETVDAIRVFAVFLPLICLTGCMTGYFTAANRIATLAAVEIAEQLCYMIVTLFSLNMVAGRNAEKACEVIVLGSGISSCLTLACLMILRFREKPPRGNRIPIASRLAHTAIPLAMADDLKSGINTIENLMVPKRLSMYPHELSPLATFGIVIGMVFPVLMFPAAILFALAELLIPELARCSASGSHRRIRYLVRRGLKVALLYGCLCGGVLYLIATELCDKLYNNSVAGSYLRLYSILAPMLYCDSITDAMIKGLGQQTHSVRYNILTSSLDVLFLYVLLPRYGMIGYFTSFLITHLINFILSIRRLIKISEVRVPIYEAAFAIASTLIGVVLSQSIHFPFWRIFCFLLIWPCLLTIFGVVQRSDVSWMVGLLSKQEKPCQ